MPSTTVLTLFIFAATIFLILVKPGDLHEAWWTLLGASLMLTFGLVAPHDLVVVARTGKSAMLFLLALLLLAVLEACIGSQAEAARIARTLSGRATIPRRLTSARSMQRA